MKKSEMVLLANPQSYEKAAASAEKFDVNTIVLVDECPPDVVYLVDYAQVTIVLHRGRS